MIDTAIKTEKKDPDARLDYTWDWADWLVGGDTIVAPVTFTITPDDGTLLVETPVLSPESFVVMISGGTLGRSYLVSAHINTSQGREDDRSRRLVICQR